MSKNLGNIPKQVKMTEEQEQVFTNGINKGRKLVRDEVVAWVNEHRWGTEIEPGIILYRDHYSTESLLEFLEGLV